MKGLKWNAKYNGIGSVHANSNFPFARKIDRLFEPGINSAICPFGKDKANVGHAKLFFMCCLGAAQPIADLLKDIPDTFKSYKSPRHVKQDALQPVRGVGNIIRGVLAPVGLIFLCLGCFLFVLFVAPIDAIKSRKIKTLFTEWLFAVILITLLALPALIESAASIFRGVTQLITTPLTWFLRMPLRGILTASGYKPIEENNGIKRLVDIANCPAVDSPNTLSDLCPSDKSV